MPTSVMMSDRSGWQVGFLLFVMASCKYAFWG
jgi:hypothetical protein